jgi:beta-phosphoglucomutase family hydrolase
VSIDPEATMLGLPAHIEACLFDLDGVLTDTAALHAAAWKETFDEYLREHADQRGADLRPFDVDADYPAYVDGKPRADGVRDFLAARGITLPEGSPDDPPGSQTVNGIGNRKNAAVQRLLRDEGVRVFEDARLYLRAAARAGLRRAVVSSSANTREVLDVAGLSHDVEARVDGATIHARGLRGKPAPDAFWEAARMLDVDPGDAAVFEDALAGVAAGRSGGFGLVVGVDRVGHDDQLRAHGADVVVRELTELLGETTRREETDGPA